jgi:hypothetical protein
MSKAKRLSLWRLRTPPRKIWIDLMTGTAIPSQSSTAARSFHSPRRAAACGGKTNTDAMARDFNEQYSTLWKEVQSFVQEKSFETLHARLRRVSDEFPGPIFRWRSNGCLGRCNPVLRYLGNELPHFDEVNHRAGSCQHRLSSVLKMRWA